MLKLGQVLTLKNCIEPFSYASTAYVVASALVSVRPICKNLSNLQNILGQMVYRPPWPKIASTPMIKCDGLRRERMLKWTILSFDVVQLRWTELLEGWPLGAEVRFMVVDSNVDGAARWGRRIRQNSIRNCFHDGIIDVILNIWWDRRGFMQIDYVCWNFKFRWKRRCRKTGRSSQLSASLSTEST